MSFYGQAPHPSNDWLQVPAPKFWCYVRAMPRIEANQALARISQTGAGSGAMKEQDQRAYLRDLRRHAAGRRERSHKASLGEIAAIGIPVKRVPVKEANV